MMSSYDIFMLELELKRNLLRKYSQEMLAANGRNLRIRRTYLKYNKRKLWHSQ